MNFKAIVIFIKLLTRNLLKLWIKHLILVDCSVGLNMDHSTKNPELKSGGKTHAVLKWQKARMQTLFDRFFVFF